MSAADVTGLDVYDLLTREAAQSPPGAHGTIYIPWLAGAACPYYDSYARAVMLGMTFAHKKSDLVRGAMEGICFEMRDMLESLQEAPFKRFEYYRVTGGAARSAVWNQIQADIYGRPVETVKVPEATALGAAMLGALGAGIYKDIHQTADHMVHMENRWEPIAKNVPVYNELFAIFRDTYQALKDKVFPAISKFQGVVEAATDKEVETAKAMEVEVVA
jgi:xylulokinase